MHGLIAFAGCIRGARGLPLRRNTHLILQFKNDSFSRLFAHTAHTRNGRDVAGNDGSLEHFNTHPAEDRERQLRAHARDMVHQEPEKIAFPRCAESVKYLGILAHNQMGEDFDVRARV